VSRSNNILGSWLNHRTLYVLRRTRWLQFYAWPYNSLCYLSKTIYNIYCACHILRTARRHKILINPGLLVWTRRAQRSGVPSAKLYLSPCKPSSQRRRCNQSLTIYIRRCSACHQAESVHRPSHMERRLAVARSNKKIDKRCAHTNRSARTQNKNTGIFARTQIKMQTHIIKMQAHLKWRSFILFYIP